MSRRFGRPLMALLGGLVIVLAAQAGPPACEPGYMIVEEVCYTEVV